MTMMRAPVSRSHDPSPGGNRDEPPAAQVRVTAPSVLSCITRLNAGGPARQVVWLLQGVVARGGRSRLLFGRVQGGEDDLSRLARDAALDLVELPALGREIVPASEWRALQAVVRQIVAFRPEIVHTHTSKAGFVGRLAVKLCRLTPGFGPRRPRAVHTFHGHVLSGYFGGTKQAAVRWLERRLGRNASDAVIVLSPQQRDDIVARYRIVSADRVFVVPIAVDPSELEVGPDEPPLRAELAVPSSAFLTGIVGRLAPVKDHRLFLAAAAVLVRSRPEARFVVVGGGPLEAELRDFAAQLGITERVHFLGLRTDLARIYAALDAVALTSLQEGTPLALLEAMAAGRPVVATAVGGVPDLLLREWSGPVHRRSFSDSPAPRGLLVEGREPEAVAAALETLILEPSRARQLVADGRRYVHRFHGVERLVDDVLAVYRRLLCRPASRRKPADC